MLGYPVLVDDTKIIVQSNSCFVHRFSTKRFDVFNPEASIFFDHFTGALSTSEIVSAVVDEYPDASPDLVTTDLEKLIAFMEERGYLRLARRRATPQNDGIEFSDLPETTRAVFADMEVTTNCNLGCRYCYAASTAQQEELPDAEWREVLTLLKSRGLRAVKVSGGEPFMYKDIATLLPWISSQFITSLNSNGFTIDGNRAEWLASLNLQEVQISLDSASPALHDRMRGSGSWAVAMTAIENLVTAGVPLRLSATIGLANGGEIDALRTLALGVGAPLNLEVMKPVGRGQDLEASEYLTDACFMESPRRAALEYMEVRCQAQLGLVALSHDGQLKPCNLPKPFFTARSVDVVTDIREDFEFATSRTFVVTDEACNQTDMATLRPTDNGKCIFSS